MAERTSISLFDEADGSMVVILADRDGDQQRIGPRLRVSTLGDCARADASYIFIQEADSPRDLDHLRDRIDSALSRTEQIALDKMYAGVGSTRQASRTRGLVLWAAMTIRALAEHLSSGEELEEGVERRINCLITLAMSEGIAPLMLSGSASVAAAKQPAMPFRRRSMATLLASHIRNSRLPDAEELADASREITLQPFQNRWAIFYEIAAGIAFTTFASAGSFVFLGVRLQKCSGLCKAGGITGFSASLDIISLVICSFGFLFATLSYANATGVLARLSTMNYEEALERGNRVSEYFGVYPLVLAIPLAVEGATSSPIPLIVKLVGLFAFFGYHWSPRFSLLERVIKNDALGSDGARRCVVIILLGLLSLTWFGPNIDSGDGGLWIRVVASGSFLISICSIYVLASLVPEQTHPSRYVVHRDDILSEESPSVYDLQPLTMSLGYEPADHDD